MTENVHIVVLTYTEFGEKSIVLHTITKEYGRRGFLVRPGKKTPMTLFQPMNLLEASVSENHRSSLSSAHGFSAVDPLAGIRSDIRKSAITMFMSEVLYRVVRDGAREEGMFEWLEKSIITLERLETDFSNFHLRFLLELAVILGFSPSSQDLLPFAGEHVANLTRLVTSSFSESMMIPLSGAERTALCDIIIRYLEHYTESSIRIRSLSVLHDLFA